MTSPRPRFILTCSVASLLAATAATVQAQTADNWTGATSKDWNTASNWDLGAVPDDSNTATFPNGVNAFVNTATGNIATVTTNVPSPTDIFIGSINGATGRLDVTAGSLANTGSAWTYVGVGGATGTLNVADTTTTGGTFTGFGKGSGSYTVGFRLFVGGGQNGPNDAGTNNTGTGTLNVNTTGTETIPNDLYFGGSGGGNGTLNIDAATVNHTGGWTFIGGDREVAGGTGTVNMSGGTFNNNTDTYLGRGAGSTGTFNLTGGTYANGGNLVMGTTGNNGVSTFTQSGAGTVTTVGGETQIGNSTANNVFNMNGGSFTGSSWIAIGRAGGTGTLNINGGTFTKDPAGNGFFDVGAGGGAGPSNGTVNLNTGGTLQVPKIITEQGTSTFNFNGGTVLMNGDGTANQNGDVTFLQGLTTANVRAGGAVFNTNGFNPTIGQALVHSTVAGDSATTDGGLTKLGSGTLTLSGTNTYIGTTTVSTGTLSLAATGSIANSSQIRVSAGATFDVSSQGTFTVGAGQTLTGTGTVNSGALTLSGSVLAPGATPAAGSTGTLAITNVGALTLTNTATLQFDILSPTNKDLVTANGALNINGNNTLALNLGAGLAPGTYVLFSGLTSESGTFTTVTGLTAGEAASFSFSGGNYDLTISGVPEPSTWVAGALCLGSFGWWLRKRRAC